MSTEDLSKHLSTRNKAEPAHPLLYRRLEEMLAALSVPFSRDSDGDFVIESRYGNVMLFANSAGDMITLHHFVGTVENNPRKKGEFYAYLLRLNMSTVAKLALAGEAEDKEWSLHALFRCDTEELNTSDLRSGLFGVLELASAFADDE